MARRKMRDIQFVEGELRIGDSVVGTSQVEDVTADAAEINLIDGSIAGTVVASKAVAVDSNKDIASFRNVTLTGNLVGAKKVVEAHTSGDTLAATESNSIHTNEGASGAITIVLPAAVAGLEFTFCVMANQELRIDPNSTETIGLPSTGAQGAAGKYLSADAIGEWVRLTCVKAGQWFATGYAGTWTAEG